MSVALWSGSALPWERELSALKSRLAPVFGRREIAASAGAFLAYLGYLAYLARHAVAKLRRLVA